MEDVLTQPRLLQTFLGLHGVFEVGIVLATHELRCTCPGFINRRGCKHVRWVADRLGPDGEYNVVVPHNAMDDVLKAKESDASWREFITRYVTPEVI